jgi:hypothetical protein
MLDNSENNKNNKREGFHPIKAIGMMGACCILPFVVIAVLPLLNLGTGSTAFLSTVSSLICPIMMVLMMIVMFFGGRKKSCCASSDSKDK